LSEPAPTGALTPARAVQPAFNWQALLPRWPLWAALALLAVPTILRLSRQSWTTDAGSHGPIVLATGLWLLHHIWAEIRASAGKPLTAPLILLALVPLTITYALGAALDLLLVEALALYGVFLLTCARFIGIGGIWRNLFPFLYLAFLIPLPGWVLDGTTLWLQNLISAAASGLLSAVGYPIIREGVVLYIAQYQLLVEDACSGMNSLVGLTAISLFYIYILHRAQWRHALILTAAIFPIAIFVNLVRVLLLILITYYFGDAVGQGFVHNLAGIMLFTLALGLMVGADALIRRFTYSRRAVLAHD